MVIPQMRCLSSIWLEVRHFIRSVSDHGKYGKLRLLTVGVHLCMVLVVSVVAMATRGKNLKKGKMDTFVICVILVSFTPSGHTQGLQCGY